MGCHQGEIIDLFLKYAPSGTHFAFEPLPHLYNALIQKYKSKPVQFYNIALSNYTGISTFNYVVNNPAYSGLQKRKYKSIDEKVVTLEVQTDTLDQVIPPNKKIDVIKIDVEGGEWQVLEGAKKCIATHKPVIIFEHGLGASEYYGSNPIKIFSLLHECGLKISTMGKWLRLEKEFTLAEFETQFNEQLNYYFIAYP